MKSCVIIAISTCTHACFSHHSQWNNWIILNQDETVDVNQVKTMKSRLSCSESSGKLWIKWKSISTAVRMFPPRWEYFHRGDNIPTAVETFSPRWKHSHRGGNIITAVETFSPRWEYYHRGGNILTALEIFPPRWKYFFTWFIIVHLIHYNVILIS